MLAWTGIVILVIAAITLVLFDNPGVLIGVTNADFAQLAYGLALLVVIGGSTLLVYRGKGTLALRHAASWLAIALAVLVVYSYRAEFLGLGQRVLGELVPGLPIASTVTMADGEQRVVTIRANATGHFDVRTEVNGVPLNMVADTGATLVTLTYQDATEAGIDVDALFFIVPIQTANGTTQAAEVRLDSVSVGGITVKRLKGLVARDGALFRSLLGMNYLSTIGGFDLRGDELVLRQ